MRKREEATRRGSNRGTTTPAAPRREDGPLAMEEQ
jgi:hypothetical protein